MNRAQFMRFADVMWKAARKLELCDLHARRVVLEDLRAGAQRIPECAKLWAACK